MPVKSKEKISQNFVAFSEYMNFTKHINQQRMSSRFDLIYETMDLSRILLPVKRFVDPVSELKIKAQS